MYAELARLDERLQWIAIPGDAFQGCLFQPTRLQGEKRYQAIQGLASAHAGIESQLLQTCSGRAMLFQNIHNNTSVPTFLL